MNIDLTNRLYKMDNRVYLGTTELNVHNQRGRLFVKHSKKQINLKNIPILPNGVNELDPVFDYVFGGLFQSFPCHAVDYWIYRFRLGHKITTGHYKERFL